MRALSLTVAGFGGEAIVEKLREDAGDQRFQSHDAGDGDGDVELDGGPAGYGRVIVGRVGGGGGEFEGVEADDGDYADAVG